MASLAIEVVDMTEVVAREEELEMLEEELDWVVLEGLGPEEYR